MNTNTPQAELLPAVQPTVADMLQAVIERGVTAENVAAVGELVKLFERMEDKKAERSFVEAFKSLQAELPKIETTKPVPNRDGSVRYTYAPLEDIMRQGKPIWEKHGFIVTFSEREAPAGKISEVCIVQHTSGHKTETPFTVRVGQGPPSATEPQSDGAAHSYARRGALCNALGIVVEHQDNDARAEGGAVTAEQAEELARRVAETNSNREAFLKYAGAATFAEISAVKYDILDGFLKKRETKGR